MSYKIQKDDILNFASNKDVYKQGVNYYEKGRNKNFIYDTYNDESLITTVVEDNIKDYKVNISFKKSGELKSFGCNCTESIMWKGACKHIVCALLKLEEESQKINSKLNMEKGVKNIIKICEAQTYQDISNKIVDSNIHVEKVNVKPCLCVNHKGQIYLTFSIGTSKYYMIKNINVFIENIDNNEVYNYGKDFVFNHDIKLFDSKSKQIISFIRKILNVYNSIPFYEDVDKYLYLNEDELDNFFRLYKEEVINIFVKEFSTKHVYLTQDYPNDIFDIKINYDLNIINLKYKPFKFIILKGMSYNYILTEDFLFRIDKKYAELLASLISNINVVNNNTLKFENADFYEFINFVLPILKNMKLINIETNILDKYKNNKPIIKVYFDYIDKKVTCNILIEDENNQDELKHIRTSVMRDKKIEYELLEIIKVYGFEDIGNKYYTLSQSDKIYNFYLTGLETIKNISEVYMSEEFMSSNINKTPKTFIKVGIIGNLLELNFDTSSYNIDELLEAVKAYSLKKKYYRFKDGSYINLENKEIAFMSKIMDTLDIDQDSFLNDSITLPKYRTLYIDDISNDLGLEFKKDYKVNNLLKDFNNFQNLHFSIPKGLDNIMRPYQKVGYNWLKVLNHYGFGGILADDMGLGKTIQTIALLESEKNDIPSLIVAPTSLIYNWAKEIEKFASNLKVLVLNGTATQRKEQFINSNKINVYITTYDTLKKDINMYTSYKFKFVIADEAQNIKNHLTQNSKTIKKLNSCNRFALTGTPIENSLSELWSIFDFIMPGYLFNYSKFLKTYGYPIMKDNNKHKEYLLRKQIQPFILRRVKSDVLKELPEKVETTIYADMTKEQREIYVYNLLKARGEFEKIIEDETFNKNQIMILSSLTRLRQICCHPSLFVENYKGGSGKLNATLEYVHQALTDGHRILLFSQFTSMLSIIKDKFTEDKIKFLYIDGSTSSKERLELIEKFNVGEGQVFLISLKSGGTGLNLTGADVVIHYDQWWNPSVMNQATDRAHRFGQEKVVQVVNVVIKETIEEKILELHDKKKNLTDSVIKEGVKFINNMTKEDLIDIFNI